MSLRDGSKRKYPAIDILRLYTRGDVKGWNQMLSTMLMKHDVEGIKRTLYGIQAGMADAADAGLSDSKLVNWFMRAQKSLEDTAKKVFREKYPNPLDNPLNAGLPDHVRVLEAKRNRDAEFERFLREARF